MIKLYYGAGACSFVPHVALETIQAATGDRFEAQLIKLHKGEQRSAEFVALNPHAQVPVLEVDGQVLTQIIAICDYLDRRYPQAYLLPADSWARAQALSKLAWMNNTVHTTFTRIMMNDRFAGDEAARTDVRKTAVEQYRAHLAHIDGWAQQAKPYLLGNEASVLDSYALTLLRWGGFAGIEAAEYPALTALVDRLVQLPPVAAAMARERITMQVPRAA